MTASKLIFTSPLGQSQMKALSIFLLTNLPNFNATDIHQGPPPPYQPGGIPTHHILKISRKERVIEGSEQYGERNN